MMNLKFIVFALLATSIVSTLTTSQRAACIREKLPKLSINGQVYFFGVKDTKEGEKFQLPGFYVGGANSEIGIPKDHVLELTKNRVVVEKKQRTETTSPSFTISKPQTTLHGVVQRTEQPGSRKTKSEDKSIEFKDSHKIKEVLVAEHKITKIEKQAQKDKLGKVKTALEARKLYAKELEKSMVHETNPKKVQELKDEFSNVTVHIKKLVAKKAKVERKIEKCDAKLKVIKEKAKDLQKETIDMDKMTAKQLALHMKKKDFAKRFQKLSATVETLKEAKDKLKKVEDSMDSSKKTKLIKKYKLKVKELKKTQAKQIKKLRYAAVQIKKTTRIIKKIRREHKAAKLKDTQKYGKECTSYSIRPSTNVCAIWVTRPDGDKLCVKHQVVYRVSKCVEKDTRGHCLKTKFHFSATAPRYKCESHSTEFARTKCMGWKNKNGKAVCAAKKTFYQSKACREFVFQRNTLKCDRHQVAYPSFRCLKNIKINGKVYCKKLSAYSPTFYCKEYMIVKGHRMCKRQELFYGKKIHKFECQKSQQFKDKDGEVHCMKYKIKRLSEFKNYKVRPISTRTIMTVKKRSAHIHRECKKIVTHIKKDKKLLMKCNKKIVELEKTIKRVHTEKEKIICKTLIMKEQKKIAELKSTIEGHTTVMKNLKKAYIAKHRFIALLKNEREGAKKQLTIEAKKIATANKKLVEDKKALQTEKDKAKIEIIKKRIHSVLEEKKLCKAKVTEIKNLILKKTAEIKKGKVHSKILAFDVKRKYMDIRIKKTANLIVTKTKALEEKKSTLSKTTNQVIKEKLAKEIKSLESDIKSGKVQLKKEKRTEINICKKEIAAVRKETHSHMIRLEHKKIKCETVIRNMQKIIDNSKKTVQIEKAKKVLKKYHIKITRIEKAKIRIVYQLKKQVLILIKEHEKIKESYRSKALKNHKIKSIALRKANKIIKIFLHTQKIMVKLQKKTDKIMTKKGTKKLQDKIIIKKKGGSSHTKEEKHKIIKHIIEHHKYITIEHIKELHSIIKKSETITGDTLKRRIDIYIPQDRLDKQRKVAFDIENYIERYSHCEKCDESYAARKHAMRLCKAQKKEALSIIKLIMDRLDGQIKDLHEMKATETDSTKIAALETGIERELAEIKATEVILDKINQMKLSVEHAHSHHKTLTRVITHLHHSYHVYSSVKKAHHVITKHHEKNSKAFKNWTVSYHHYVKLARAYRAPFFYCNRASQSTRTQKFSFNGLTITCRTIVKRFASYNRSVKRARRRFARHHIKYSNYHYHTVSYKTIRRAYHHVKVSTRVYRHHTTTHHTSVHHVVHRATSLPKGRLLSVTGASSTDSKLVSTLHQHFFAFKAADRKVLESCVDQKELQELQKKHSYTLDK